MTRIIILAAGRGTRMNSVLPKVLVSLKNRPLIKYLLDAVFASGVDPRPIIVVSPDNREIISQELVEYNLEYVVQEKQLGTAQAVACAKEASRGADKIIVLYGDHPFVTAASIKSFSELSPDALTIMPIKPPDFNGWHGNFYHWGRIIRDDQGKVIKITEFKDATEKEKLITELNPGFMCFQADWLFFNIDHLSNNNQAQEYYLTDLVGEAVKGGYLVETINISPREALGINSPEELQIATELLA